MQNFKSLKAYQSAFDLGRLIHSDLKDCKNYRLRDQLFGSTTSICANLAEMAAFETKAQKEHKIRIAIGEANETEFWLDFCSKTGVLDTTKHQIYSEKIIETRKMLIGLLKSMK
ncbi:hypothetical protein COT47_02155 [Candidatus Woesearchaeota archaeon CG08_land_8_20_14_0_20_43_7]|nr:MAG: hypothetical protein COT47_02155 [Candidatus Woesearchaeota archaeon CG08_land_8_20_14_0_20_43_7]